MNTHLELQYKAVISTQTCVAKAFVDVNLHYCNISICSNDLNLRLLLRHSNAEVKKWLAQILEILMHLTTIYQFFSFNAVLFTAFIFIILKIYENLNFCFSLLLTPSCLPQPTI